MTAAGYDSGLPRPLIAVAVFPGSNDDRDAQLALERLGADARFGDGEAEVPQAALDCLALWIEDPRLRPHQHGRLHPSTTSGRAR